MRDPDKPQQIIDAAIRVFARNGYYNSRVSDIAREAGIASGTIYLYFKTKDEILVTLFREKMAEWVASVRREVAAERDPLAKVRRSWRSISGCWRTTPSSRRCCRSSSARDRSFSAGRPRRRSRRTSA
jgi:AcrR family transcriptional regulator